MTTAYLDDVFSPGHFSDPYPWYREVRAQTPARMVGREAWVFMKHRDVGRILRDPQTFSSAGMGGVGAFGLPLIGDDPPRHGHLRGIINRAFTPRRVAELEPWIAAAGAGLIGSFASGILKDKGAVCAAITEPWSNGQTEGQITKLKLMKRQMYGRAKIDLLQARLIGAV